MEGFVFFPYGMVRQRNLRKQTHPVKKPFLQFSDISRTKLSFIYIKEEEFVLNDTEKKY